MWTVVIEGFPADIPETWYDCPKAVDRLGPGVVLDAGHSTERKDLTSLKKLFRESLKQWGLHNKEHVWISNGQKLLGCGMVLIVNVERHNE